MSDVSPGDWIPARLGGVGAPSGFEACALVRHPVFRERPVGASWPPPGDERAWARFAQVQPEVDVERVTWRKAAEALGADLRAGFSWADVTGPVAATGDVRDGDGWRYDDPDEGALDAETLAALAGALVAHTTTPDSGYAAIWDGWDGLVGRAAPSASGAPRDDGGSPRHAAVLRESFTDALNAPFRRKAWQPGVLSDEISRGPRLEASGRSHILFRAAPRAWAGEDWPDHVPWSEPEAPWLHSPSLIWPDDRAWLVVTDPDAQTTTVAGSAALVRALVQADDVEAVEAP